MNLLVLKAVTPWSKHRSFKGTVGKIAPNICIAILKEFKRKQNGCHLQNIG